MGIEWVKREFAKNIIISVLGDDVADCIEPHAMLIDDLGADSLDMVEIQMMLEHRGISAPDEAFTNRMTVRDLANLIQPVSVPA